MNNKKGLSVMIGYILLITIAIAMSLLVYRFVKTYVPTDTPSCPDEVSIFLQEVEYDSESGILNVTVKNNGNFNIAGYFIYATTSEDQELATLDLSGNLTSGGTIYSNSVLFVLGENFLAPGEAKKMVFTDVGVIYKIKIVPVRFQEEDGATKFVSCGDAAVEEILNS